MAGLNVESINVDDGDDYELAGEGITLGGGLTASPAIGSSGADGDFIELPITLDASQRWTVAGRTGGGLGENGLFLAGDLSGSSDALTTEISNEAALYLAGETEVGPVAIEGADTSQPGVFNGYVSLFGGALDFSDEEPVSFNHIFFFGDGSMGPLTTDASEFFVGSGKRLETRSATFDAASEVGFEISGAGTVAGKDYSQLASTGPVTLGGSSLLVHVSQPPKKKESEPEPPCPSLSPGQKYVFVSSSGAISGSFVNAPEGGPEITIGFAKSCSHTSQKMRISYDRSEGTETVTGTVEAEAKEGQEEEVTKRKQEEEEASKRRNEEEETAASRKTSQEEGLRKFAEENADREASEVAAREALARRQQEELSAATTKRQQEEEASAKAKEEEEKVKLSRPPTRAQLLAKAVGLCRKQPKKRRARCEATAKKKFGPQKKAKRK